MGICWFHVVIARRAQEQHALSAHKLPCKPVYEKDLSKHLTNSLGPHEMVSIENLQPGMTGNSIDGCMIVTSGGTRPK